MTVLSGIVAQLLHIALVLAAAPTLAGIQRWMQARLAGRVGPSLLQPWRDLIRLSRKSPMLAESASGVTAYAPMAVAAAIGIAACLVPSFTLGMAFAPLADLLLIAGLLMAARAAMSLAALDAGTTPGGMAGSRIMLLGCLAEPALLLVLFVLALLAGSLDLDLIAAMQVENGLAWRIGVGIALAATVLTAWEDATPLDAAALDLAGRDLALIEAAAALRLLVWFNLIGAMFLPLGMAPPGGGPLAWTVGVAAWLARTLVLAAALVLSQAAIGRVGPQRAARVLGVAVLLGLLAAVFVLADMTGA
jgi:formate hydrogenlyase subunit 4